MKNKNHLIALLLMINVLSFGQMNRWAMPPSFLQMNSTPPSGITGSGSYGVANSAYDASGNLLFYVSDKRVYAPNNTSVGELGYILPGGSPMQNYLPVDVGGEMIIVPVPGACSQYYLIYAMGSPGTGNYVYIKVDCSSGTPVLIYANPTQQYQQGFGNYYQAFSLGTTQNELTGLAVSQMIGTGAGALYYLYAATSSGIMYHTISAGGITAGSSIGSFAATGYNTTELELSPNGNWLAWSDGGNVNVVGLTGTHISYSPLTLQKYNYGASSQINGLEFAGNYALPDLYVAGYAGSNSIFNKITISSTTPIQAPIALGASRNFNTTFLEYAKNGCIYGIYNNGTGLSLIGYNITTGAINSSAINVNSNHSNANAQPELYGVFTLPDQIDGADYNNFSTIPIVYLNQMTMNGIPFQNTCPGNNFEVVYNCAPITINATYTGGTPCNYLIFITPLDQNCNVLSFANHFSYGYGSTISHGWNLNGLDIRSLYTTYANSLYNQPGYYSVMVKTIGCCGDTITQTSYIQVLQAIPPVLNLEIYNTYYNPSANPPAPYVAPSQNISSPIATGALTAQFRINNSTGSATSYNVTIDQVSNASPPALIKNIYNKTIPVSNISGIAVQPLNSLCYPSTAWSPTIPGGGNCSATSPSYSGYTGYFGYSNGLLTVNNYYKLTVSLNNQCSSATNYSYLFVNNGYALPTSIDQHSFTIPEVSIYPNPASDEVKMKINTSTEGLYTISLYDVSGRLVKKVANDLDLSAGEHILPINTSELEQGIYTYKINSSTLNKTGLINISK